VGAGVGYLRRGMGNAVWRLSALPAITGFAAGGVRPPLSALLATYTAPGAEGAVYGLEASIMSAARAISPMIGAALVGALGMRSLFTGTGLLFVVLALTSAHFLPGRKGADAKAPRKPVIAR